jgi:phosphatidylglycerophosphatase A
MFRGCRYDNFTTENSSLNSFMKSAALTVKTFALPTERSVKDNFALLLATCGGVGFIPLVPASWGSLAGVGVYLLAQKANEIFTSWAQTNQFAVFNFADGFSAALVCLLGLFLVGIWAATRVEKLTGEKDPRIVVIDEVVGQLLTFLFVPARLGWWTVLAGFLIFRLFDIWKLYPADKLESLPTGLGAMADDLMAGFYAATAMSLLCSAYLAVF